MNHGLTRIGDGYLPEQHSIEDIFGKDQMVDIDREPRDPSVNDEIQEKGAHSWPSIR